ncbi:MAG: ATP-binding protein [Cyclobacteriaceae bacterium]|nr:ATP-binding protein [Cyclobacteriaceae bacterium]
MIARKLEKLVKSHLTTGKAVILIGPRQVGKTTLLKSMMAESTSPTLFINCDEPDMRALLSNKTSTELKAIIGNHKLVIIDEAQRVKNIGLSLKLIIDQIKSVQLIVSGSSALELANEINEPLTGRKWEFTMYPLSSEELIRHTSALEENRLLTTRLIYGLYPDVVNNPGSEKEILKNLTDSYLYKDLFSFKDVRKPEVIEKILQALSLQVGSEVSYNEIADLVKSDPQTVSRYIDLLEKTMVVYRLPSFSRNLRNELKKSRKVYFYDNGVRNAIIANFQPIELRKDAGALWENFILTERMKFTSYANVWSNIFFWRTKQQQEIDYIEERDGKLYTFEFKWGKSKKDKAPVTFTNAYPESEHRVITPENYQSFIS